MSSRNLRRLSALGAACAVVAALAAPSGASAATGIGTMELWTAEPVAHPSGGYVSTIHSVVGTVNTVGLGRAVKQVNVKVLDPHVPLLGEVYTTICQPTPKVTFYDSNGTDYAGTGRDYGNGDNWRSYDGKGCSQLFAPPVGKTLVSALGGPSAFPLSGDFQAKPGKVCATIATGAGPKGTVPPGGVKVEGEAVCATIR